MNQQYPSVLLEKAVDEFSRLPGIGRKTAMRLVLHLLRQDTESVEAFGNAIVTLKHEVKYCKVCHNISDTDVCRICSTPSRDSSIVCVVENIRDVMASCAGRCDFTYGWCGTERFADRQPCGPCKGRWSERDNSCIELYYGG